MTIFDLRSEPGLGSLGEGDCGLKVVRYNGPVSTIAEIEAAIGKLAPAEQMQLLRDLPTLLSPELQDLEWLQAAEPSFAFWENEEDAVYDEL